MWAVLQSQNLCSLIPYQCGEAVVSGKEKEFTERVREASDQNQEKTVKECKQKINKDRSGERSLTGL